MPHHSIFASEIESKRSSTSSRYSQRRKIEQSELPPYQPEQEIANIKDSFSKQKKTNYFSLFRYATIGDKILITIGILLSMLSSVFVTWRIYTLGRLLHGILANATCIDSADKRKQELLKELVDSFFWNTVINFGVEFVVRSIANLCLSVAADKQTEYMRVKLFSSLVIRDMSWYDYFVNRYYFVEKSEAITKIRIGIGETLGKCVTDICETILLLTLCMLVNYEVTLCLLAVFPIGILSAILGTSAEHKVRQCSQISYTAANVFSEEVLANIKMAKVYEGEQKLLKQYGFLLGKPSWTEMKWLIVAALSISSLYIGCNTAYWCVFWWMPTRINVKSFCKASKSFLEHHHTFLEIYPTIGSSPCAPIIIFLSIFVAANTIIDIPKYIYDMIEAKDQAAEVFFAMDINPRINNPALPGLTPRSAGIGRIEFVDVGFRYVREPQVWAVREVTMTMYPGQVIAIVGAPGSGKTTILKLIDRLYDTCEGQIFFDGNHVQGMDVNWLRRQICYVMQDPILFNTTIEKNIRCAKKNVKMQDIFEACKTVELHSDILELAHGYSTVVGHKGSVLNEQQRRLVCLARAFLHRPRIILLDDPQPNPDDYFDSLLQNIVQKLREQATIVVTSRKCPTLVKNADFIFVMHKGKVVESGNHKKLLAQNSFYHRLLRKSLDVGDTKKRFPSQLEAYRYSHNLQKLQEEKEKADKVFGRVASKEFLRKVKRGVGDQHPRLNDLGGYGFVGSQRKQSRFNLSFTEKQNLLKRTPTSSYSSILIIDGEKKTKIDKKKPTKSTSGKELKVISEANSQTNRRHSRDFLRDDPDQLSICSEDSFIFWDDYLERLDSWLKKARVAKWMEFFSLAVKRQVWPLTLIGIIVSILIGIYVPTQAYILGDIFLAISEKNTALRTNELEESFYFLYIGAACALASFIQIIVFGIAGNKLCSLLRVEVFEKMLEQDMQWYDMSENDIRVLSEILTNDTESVQKHVMLFCAVIFQCLSWFLLSIIWAIWLNPAFLKAAICMVAITPVLFYVSYIQRKRLLSHDDILNWNLEPSTELAFEVINNIKVVAALNLEKHYIEEYRKRLHRPSRLHGFYNIWGILLIAISNPLQHLVMGIFVRYGYQEDIVTDEGYHNFRDMLRIAWLLIAGVGAAAQQLALLPSSKRTRTALNKINSIMTSKSALFEEQPDTCILHVEPPVVVLKDVAFQYPVLKEKQVLHGVTLEFLPETFVAIVGPSGSGKTTIANLISRLYDPTSGGVYFGSEKAVHMALCTVRKLVSMVDTADIGLINMTIEETIKFGENFVNLSLSEVVAVAKLTQIHEEIMSLPSGYQTQVHALPHTQEMYALKQRIALARAIIGDPKILILDGFTTAVDYISAQLMQEAIVNARVGRTLIVLSDIIDPIRNADFIVVMNNGYISETGEDSTLVEKKGLYYNLLMTQRLVNESLDIRLSLPTDYPEVEAVHDRRKSSVGLSLIVSNPRKNSQAYSKFIEQGGILADHPYFTPGSSHVNWNLPDNRKDSIATSKKQYKRGKKENEGKDY